MLTRLEEEYPQDLRVVYRHFPLVNNHDKALLATQAAEAAGSQGEFWAMHDLLFERQDEWKDLSIEDFQGWLSERAAELDLDVEQFNADMLSEENQSLAQSAWETNRDIGLPGTPSILINSKYYNGPRDFGSLEIIMNLLLLEERQYTQCPPQEIDPLKSYQATITTEKGDIVVELYPEAAPFAVNSFVFLARNGWYDGVTFHRVLPGQIAQAGDPTGTGFGGPGYAFSNEIAPDLKFDQPGVFAMANAGPDSNGSQFFITTSPAPSYDGLYTIFGQVIEGMDVVRDLSARNPAENANLPPGDEILSITIEER